jgi:hypothetical protein
MTPLRQRMLDDMQIRNLAPATQRAYVEHVGQFARHFGRSPAALGPEEIRTYQVYLAKDKQVAPATLGVAVAALRFLYTVTLQKRWAVEVVIPTPKTRDILPVVLSPAVDMHSNRITIAAEGKLALKSCSDVVESSNGGRPWR